MYPRIMSAFAIAMAIAFAWPSAVLAQSPCQSLPYDEQNECKAEHYANEAEAAAERSEAAAAEVEAAAAEVERLVTFHKSAGEKEIPWLEETASEVYKYAYEGKFDEANSKLEEIFDLTQRADNHQSAYIDAAYAKAESVEKEEYNNPPAWSYASNVSSSYPDEYARAVNARERNREQIIA